MLVSEAFERHRQDVIVFSNQSKKTEENSFICLKSLLTEFGDIEIESLTFEMIRDWKIGLEKGRTPETVRNYVIKLRVVLAYCYKRHIEVIDPDTIPVPKRTDKVPAFISKEDVAKLIQAACKLRNKCIISLLYASGIRVSELCSLDRDSIKDDTFTIVGKGGKARLCFIDVRTRTLLDLYLASRTDNNPALFTGKYDSHRLTAGNVQEIFRYTRKLAGFTSTIHPHTMRHSFATDLLRNNANMRYVQTMLGHSSLQTTQMYAHVVDEDLRKAYIEHHTA